MTTRIPMLALVLLASQASAQFDSAAFTGLRWRELGPYRGGRSVAVAGSVARPNEYWMGTVGGGVFKTTDGGQSWAPMSDRYFGGTIGSVGVAPSNPDIVYVGGGEFPLRGNVSHGDGVWKTTDAGRTWKLVGLADSKHIADLVVHPTNPDLVYAGVLGHAFGPNSTRGVYRSKDGGTTWQKVLGKNDSTGVVDLVMDPTTRTSSTPGFGRSIARRGSCGPAATDPACGSPPTAAIRGPTSRAIRVCRPACGATSASPCPRPTRIVSTR